ncbi:MAG: mannitol/fructose-specific phosphotransferase system IIA component (Ntr-type) [Planctomycetaceae bacterium]|jgi:mannitol/fructose-specific phosphotransferase system IIA component (Ntr-type)
MQNLGTAIREGLVLLDPVVSSLDEILSQVVTHCCSEGVVPVELQEPLLEALQNRESLASTAIGGGVAIPHAYLDGMSRPVIAFARLKNPLYVVESDDQAVRFVFVLIGPTGQVDVHLSTLAGIARVMSDNEAQHELSKAQSSDDVANTLDRFSIRHARKVQERTSEVTPGLTYTGRFCGGVTADIRRRLPNYVADFRDGLHMKSVTATLFLYFACLAPAVIFGGLMYGVTVGLIGATEMLVATAICGTIYALTSGHPLIILGGTGPLLVFTGILYQLCQSLGIPFLASYAWVGLWTGLFLIVLSVTDASCIIRHFTRFTDEIFAALISVIFIVEAMKSIIGYINESRAAELSHDVAFLSLLMALGTFLIAMTLSRFRKSRYLVASVREFLADFGPTLALVLMMAFGWLFLDVSPEALKVPESFGTTTGREWVVPFMDAPVWVWFAAAGPALLGTVLMYLDQNITARLVNSTDHQLKKGEAYHLDLSVVGILAVVCSILGLPWLVAATVRSLNHVRALATVEESISSSGDRRDRIVDVRENRVTGLAVHLLIAGSLLLLPLLQSVPTPVLYGLFLYMGVVSIAGNQLFERVGLWLMDSKLYPQTHYTRNVPMRTIHCFTLIQIACLIVLWLVKASPAAILFPLFIALLVPVRLLVGRFFKQEDLAALDAVQLPEEEECEWV